MLTLLDEANGYDVSYFTDVDSDRNGGPIKQHKTFLSVGHDEYWSGGQRANVTAARDAGVNLAFFSGNESFWKTRWEASTDAFHTANRTLVCYKETHANAVIDPADPSGVDNSPLHALADGSAGSNGVYSYGATSTFPANAYQASNYWVDVVFSTTP